MKIRKREELYKKHRPSRLRDVVGNAPTISTLRNMLKTGEVPHTLLFHGPSGCGKTTLARIMRVEMGCSDIDFREINASSFRGIDTVRDIMRTMTLAPSGTCRVFLLDEVHQMSKDAQNAALKMLEDTPEHVFFFLCTTEPQKLLPTILSRCTKIPVDRLKDEQIEDLVTGVAKVENMEIQNDSISDIVSMAKGSPRVALVLLDKIRHVPEDEREAVLLTHTDEGEEVIALCRALIKRDVWAKVATILKKIQEEPEAVRHAVLGYAKTVLLGSKAKNDQAYAVVVAFSNPFYDSREAGLVAACYEAIFGD